MPETQGAGEGLCVAGMPRGPWVGLPTLTRPLPVSEQDGALARDSPPPRKVSSVPPLPVLSQSQRGAGERACPGGGPFAPQLCLPVSLWEGWPRPKKKPAFHVF